MICYLRGSVVPQLLILHLNPDWSEAESEVLQEEVQHVGAAGQVVKVYVEVFVEVYAHAIWIFVVFWSNLVAQLEVIVQSMMGIHNCGIFFWICNRLLDDHRLHLRFPRHLCARI